jgi:GNAT superfamily N-acetyltransferase
MKPKLEATPEKLPPLVAGDVARLDRLLFPGDAPVKLDECWWWIIRNSKGEAVAFAGMRECKLDCNKGLAMLTRAGVCEKYRGRGLHKQLIRARVSYAKKRGAQQVIAYVKGRNNSSANALIGCGLKLYTPESMFAGEATLYFRKPL